MSEGLYNRAILDRAKSIDRAPRMDRPDASVTLDNPLCGDRVTLDLRLDGARVAEVAAVVRGCALCQASAATLKGAAVGHTRAEIAAAHGGLKSMLAGGELPGGAWATFDVFTPVARHSSRHDCVLLPFEALDQALSGGRGGG